MIYQIVLIILSLACFGSFAWGMQNLFTKPDGKTIGMQLIYYCGTIASLLHVGVLLFDYAPSLSRFVIGATLLVMSCSVFWWTARTTMSRPLSFAYSSDQPVHLLETGPYRWVRHPFYTAYTLTWIAGPVASGEPLILVNAVVMGYLYYKAAKAEEDKFLESDLDDAYQAYRKRTGMFFPKLPTD